MRPRTKIKKKGIDRGRLRDWLVEFRTRKDDEDEARCLIEEMQRNIDTAQNKSYEAEQTLWRALWEYVETFDNERARPKTIMTETLAAHAKPGHQKSELG